MKREAIIIRVNIDIKKKIRSLANKDQRPVSNYLEQVLSKYVIDKEAGSGSLKDRLSGLKG